MENLPTPGGYPAQYRNSSIPVPPAEIAWNRNISRPEAEQNDLRTISHENLFLEHWRRGVTQNGKSSDSGRVPRRVPELEHLCTPRRKCMKSEHFSPGGGTKRSPHNLAKIWLSGAGPPTERRPRSPAPHAPQHARVALRSSPANQPMRCTWRRLPSNLHCKHAFESRIALPQRHRHPRPPPSPSALAAASRPATPASGWLDATPLKPDGVAPGGVCL